MLFRPSWEYPDCAISSEKYMVVVTRLPRAKYFRPKVNIYIAPHEMFFRTVKMTGFPDAKIRQFPKIGAPMAFSFRTGEIDA